MKATADKYTHVFKIQLKEQLEYKLKWFSLLLKPFTRITIYATLWWGIFAASGSTQIAGYNFLTFLTYLLLTHFISISINPWSMSERVIESVKSGNLLSLLCRPINAMWYHLVESLPESMLNGLYALGIFLITFFVAGIWLDVMLPNMFTILLFLISVLLGICVSYLMSFIVCCLTFWVGDTWSIIGMLSIVQDFLSGKIIPLHISPLLATVSFYMPFQSMSYVPTMIFLSDYNFYDTLMLISMQLLWVIILYIIAKFIFKRGLTRFEAWGE